MKKSIVGIFIMLLLPVFSFAATTPSTFTSEQAMVDQRQELVLQLISLLRTYIAVLQQQLLMQGIEDAPLVLGVSTTIASTTHTEALKKRGGGGGSSLSLVPFKVSITETGSNTFRVDANQPLVPYSLSVTGLSTSLNVWDVMSEIPSTLTIRSKLNDGSYYDAVLDLDILHRRYIVDLRNQLPLGKSFAGEFEIIVPAFFQSAYVEYSVSLETNGETRTIVMHNNVADSAATLLLTPENMDQKTYATLAGDAINFSYFLQPQNSDVVIQKLAVTVRTPGATTTDIISQVNGGYIYAPLQSESFDSAVYAVHLEESIGLINSQKKLLSFWARLRNINSIHKNQEVFFTIDESAKSYWEILENGKLFPVSSFKNIAIGPKYIVTYAPVLQNLSWDVDTVGEKMIFKFKNNIAATWVNYQIPVQPSCIESSCVSTSSEFEILGHKFKLTGPAGFEATTTINWNSRSVNLSSTQSVIDISRGQSIDSLFTFDILPSLPGEYTMELIDAVLLDENNNETLAEFDNYYRKNPVGHLSISGKYKW